MEVLKEYEDRLYRGVVIVPCSSAKPLDALIHINRYFVATNHRDEEAECNELRLQTVIVQ